MRPNTVGEIAVFSAAPDRFIPSRWKFGRHADSQSWVSELLPHPARRAVDPAFAQRVEADNNSQAVYLAPTGTGLPRSAPVGAPLANGLGVENADLPGHVA